MPEGWTWDDPAVVVRSSTDYLDAWATYTPVDTVNDVSVSKVVKVQIDCDGSWAWDGRGWWWNRFDEPASEVLLEEDRRLPVPF